MAGIKTYIAETVNELVHKVSWPTWKELQNSSIIVFVASVIIALLIWAMDYVMGIQGSTEAVGFSWRGVLGYVYDLIK